MSLSAKSAKSTKGSKGGAGTVEAEPAADADAAAEPKPTRVVVRGRVGAGPGGSAAFDFGRLQFAPGLALELATRPGPGAATHLLFEPGVSVGTRF